MVRILYFLKVFLSLLQKQIFNVCQYPEATTLISPINNETDVFNFDVVFEWEPFDTAMIGSPCSALVLQSATAYLLIDRAQDLDPDELLPATAVFNGTPTEETYTISSFFLFFCII